MKQNQKGFTLAELLIVVAIIAVLTAIAIPLFNMRLEKSREAADLANVRAAYAKLMAAAIAEDREAVYGDVPIWNGESYQIDVPLVQTTADWQTGNGDLVVGGICQNDSSKWFDIPQPGAACSIIFESTTGFDDGAKEVHLYWDSKYYNYLPGLISGAQAAFSKTNSRVLNSSYGNKGVLQYMFKGITDEKTRNDIQTFAAVKDADQNDTYNVIYSTFSSTDSSLRGKQIPALLYDGRTKTYSVGYALISKAPDGDYNIITLGPGGEYVGNKNNAGYTSYKTQSLIHEGTTYANRSAAQAAYEKLVKQYIEENPEMQKYLPGT